jgi:formylglycine-generating enzyme required for sulfatase activity
VSQWTNTLYKDYPYRSDDGRDSDPVSQAARVIRGSAGSVAYTDDLNRRLSNRFGRAPSIQDDTIGLRCARPF